MKKQNIRPLDEIAVDINRLASGNIIEIGQLLTEARDQCEHGEWLNWLSTEFAWSADKAERCIKVAKLVAKFRNLRNLNLAATTLYQLAYREHDPELPVIIDELAKHATEKRLKASDARRIINEFGAERLRREADDSDADNADNDSCDTAANAEQEAISILDGPLPDLVPPITPPEPQRLERETAWAERQPFAEAIQTLFQLQTKPVARFIGVATAEDLHTVINFLIAVMDAEREAA